MYSWWRLGEVECVPNSKPAEGGVEVGHAHSYISENALFTIAK